MAHCFKRSSDSVYWNSPQTPLLIPVLDWTNSINTENPPVSGTSLLVVVEVTTKAPLGKGIGIK